MNVKAKNKGTTVLFESPTLEMLTRSHPAIIWGIFLPTSVYMLYAAHASHGLSVLWSFGLFTAGLFAWTLFEYLMHRYVFHFVTENPRLQRFFYFAHGVHHEYPRDKDRLFLPPLVSIAIAAILFYAFRATMAEAVYAFFPGFVMGYLLYGTMHYCIHAFNPPFKFMKPLWRYHHIHHYADHDRGFGVSTPFWDHVFGTVPRDPKETKSQKA